MKPVYRIQAAQGTKKTVKAYSRGYTLMELIAAVVIIGFLVTIVNSRIRNVGDDACVIAALNNMKAVSKAARQFHSDFGFVPEQLDPVNDTDGDDLEDDENDKRNLNPAYTTRFLCLEKDCTDEQIMEYAADWGFEYEDIRDDGHTGCYDMAICLRNLAGISDSARLLELLLSESSYGRGWQGQYLRPNALFNAAETDAEITPEIYDANGSPVRLPILATPWAGDLENDALEAQANEEMEKAGLYREGKYYQIRVSTTLECVQYYGSRCRTWEWKQQKETARIVCLGENGLDDGGTQYPVPEDIGDDMVMFIFGNGPVRSPLED